MTSCLPYLVLACLSRLCDFSRRRRVTLCPLTRRHNGLEKVIITLRCYDLLPAGKPGGFSPTIRSYSIQVFNIIPPRPAMSGSVAAWCAKLDFDSIFAYSVPRTVSIRDRTLGILQYLCMLLIVLYIVGDTVVYEQRYRLVATDIFGSARLQLVGPPTAFAQLPNETSYCEGSVSPYTGQPPIVMFPCRYLNTYAMVYPEEEASAMLIATRITEARVGGALGAKWTTSLSDARHADELHA